MKMTSNLNFIKFTSKKPVFTISKISKLIFVSIIVLFFFQHSISFGSKRNFPDNIISIELDSQKIYESDESVIYKVSDLGGHLSPLGIETAIHNIVEIKKNGIFIVDPGPHPRYANEILNSVKKIHGKDLPYVKWVFNSTGKPENVLGNSAFGSNQTVFMSSRITSEVMRSKCVQCRKDLFAAIPEPGLLDEKIIYPTYIPNDQKILHPQLGDWIIYTFECAKNSGDSVLWNQKAGILYAGRMVHVGNLPSLLHANTSEWIKSLKILEDLKPTYVVGSGSIGSENFFNELDIDMTRNYLSDLSMLVETDFNVGGNGSDADKRLELLEFKKLLGYSERHALNVQHVWRELEIKEFGEVTPCNKSLKKVIDSNQTVSFGLDKRNLNEFENSVTEIGDSTFVFTGLIDDFSKKNLGHISNYGFVVGNKCVAVIDTGGSKNTGLALLRYIRKTTSKPICFVINTHAHPDHVGGNSVFKDLNPKPEFIAHERYEAALSSRFKTFNKRMYELMGMDNVVVPEPITREIIDNLEIDLGGRKLFLKAWKTSHTDNDLTVFDVHNKVLWTGDLLFVDHMPVLDGNLTNWIKTTEEITKPAHSGSKGIQVKFIVPGHGKYQEIDSKKLGNQKKYLTKLYDLTKKAIAKGMPIREAVQKVSIEIKDGWRLSELFNKRNVTSAYAEIEWE